jgi:membrane-bound lytic murein transglycosylase D
MNRLFTLVICLISLSQITQATPATYKLFADSDEARRDTVFAPVVVNNAPLLTSYQNLYKLRLDSIQKEVPLDYNEFVQSYIDIYTSSSRKADIGRVIGLSKYYFPIYEKAFHEAGIPEEIEYLSIVESQLNPNAVSRVGATGPWQFMPATGRLFGLNINSYLDERRDPIQASYAAAAYLRDAYQEFGDWLLAIASYNCGKSSVERAIDKSGGTDFWSIRPYLPAETRNYVPAYIAIAYVMNYFKKYDITPQVCNFSIKNDTVMVNRTISLDNLAKTLDIDNKELALLNPAYRRGIINASGANPRRLILPQITNDKFAALYTALNNDAQVINPAPVLAEAKINTDTDSPQDNNTPSYHTVKRGETLVDIAGRYGIDIQDLKHWNHLRSNKLAPGRRLKLDETLADKEASAVKKPASRYIFYKVRRGDTLSEIADKFDGASIEGIKELNGLKRNALQPGMTLKITKV